MLNNTIIPQHYSLRDLLKANNQTIKIEPQLFVSIYKYLSIEQESNAHRMKFIKSNEMKFIFSAQFMYGNRKELVICLAGEDRLNVHFQFRVPGFSKMNKKKQQHTFLQRKRDSDLLFSQFSSYNMFFLPFLAKKRHSKVTAPNPEPV